MARVKTLFPLTEEELQAANTANVAETAEYIKKAVEKAQKAVKAERAEKKAKKNAAKVEKKAAKKLFHRFAKKHGMKKKEEKVLFDVLWELATFTN